MGNPLMNDAQLSQSDSRQGQNATTRPFGEANTNCAEDFSYFFLFFL
jgi:hypothetical protein